MKHDKLVTVILGTHKICWDQQRRCNIVAAACLSPQQGLLKGLLKASSSAVTVLSACDSLNRLRITHCQYHCLSSPLPVLV